MLHLALCLSVVTGFQSPLSGVGVSHGSRIQASPVMKGRGTRGMPGKGATAAGTGGGFTKASKKRMQQRDFQRSEWTLVAEKGELGDEIGSTKAVEAGMSPQGQIYIWALVRGEGSVGDDG